jgi:hypothetical protein
MLHRFQGKRARVLAVVVAATLIVGVFAAVASAHTSSRYVAGDFHTHTYLTDGERREAEVVHNAFDNFGLDWMANSEHGGSAGRDPFGNAQSMAAWRWQEFTTWSIPILTDLRAIYPDKLLVQGVEWNVPTHEHASVGFISDEASPSAVAQFEYRFDASDKDTSQAYRWTKANKTHLDAVAAATWLQQNYKDKSYFLLNHPSRKQLYSIADIRDFNNAAPDVAFGFEGMPGHQKEPSRGGYGNTFGSDTTKTAMARTYGGADYMVAKVGGLWDALLGEGRHFFTFVNSDFHNTDGDFWPGEYAKSYTRVDGSGYDALVAGLKRGDSFMVHGGLIDKLSFKANADHSKAGMGGTVVAEKGDTVVVSIKFHSPAKNNNGVRPKVDHVDVIQGDVTGVVAPTDANYSSPTNPSTRLAARFAKPQLKRDHDGWVTATYCIKNVQKDSYIRLRGTNLGLNVANQTDAQGNPLNDDLVGPNDVAQAYADLWFYSNPIFIDVQ